MVNPRTIAWLVSLTLLALSVSASAHGIDAGYRTIDDVSAVTIQAAYDTGEPMAGAQVTVYAPDNPAEPWLQGQCDPNGRFAFVPDRSQPGTWDVRVRQAGHGTFLHVPVASDDTPEAPEALSPKNSGFTPAQIGLMSACVIWGFVGTALFVVRRRA